MWDRDRYIIHIFQLLRKTEGPYNIVRDKNNSQSTSHRIHLFAIMIRWDDLKEVLIQFVTKDSTEQIQFEMIHEHLVDISEHFRREYLVWYFFAIRSHLAQIFSIISRNRLSQNIRTFALKILNVFYNNIIRFLEKKYISKFPFSYKFWKFKKLFYNKTYLTLNI